MTPDDLRAARKTLGMTQKKLAEALRMGKWGAQSVAKWEKGLLDVPGPITLGIEFLLKDAHFHKVAAAEIDPTDYPAIIETQAAQIKELRDAWWKEKHMVEQLLEVIRQRDAQPQQSKTTIDPLKKTSEMSSVGQEIRLPFR